MISYRFIRKQRIESKMNIAIMFFAILLMSFFSCRNPKQKKKNLSELETIDKSEIETEDENIRIDYDKTLVLKRVFVIDRNGCEIKQRPDFSSQTLGTYNFGAELNVIEDTANWYGILQMNYGWEKVYVSKSATGSADQIKILPKELNVISSFTINGNTKLFEKGKYLEDYISIELISKELFESKRKSSVNFLVSDTVENNKYENKVELKCHEKNIIFTDNPEIGESIREYSYVGIIDALNKYLVYCQYWEWHDYRFIDKISCEETQTFGDFPFVSANLKNIICINTNGYDRSGDIELYSIYNNKFNIFLVQDL
jgi:hypothetical protein